MTQPVNLCYSRGVGQYRSGEKHNFITDRFYKPNGTRRGILVIHGTGLDGDSSVHTPTDNLYGYVQALAAAGYPVMLADLCGATYAVAKNWGNDDHIAAIDAAFTTMTTLPGATVGLGAKNDKIGLLGPSMGGLCLNWVRQHLSEVFAVGTICGTLDPNDIYQNNKGSFQADIGTAYGVTFPSALPNASTHQPVSFGSSDLLNIPLNVWASSNDPVAMDTAHSISWGGKGASPFNVVDMGAIGHDTSQVPPQDIVAFFDAHGGRS